MCCHIENEIEVADQTFCITLSQYTDTGSCRSNFLYHSVTVYRHRVMQIKLSLSLSHSIQTPGHADQTFSITQSQYTDTGSCRSNFITQSQYTDTGSCRSNFLYHCHSIQTPGRADQTFSITQSQCTDTGLTSPSADPKTPGFGRVATGVPILKSLV